MEILLLQICAKKTRNGDDQRNHVYSHGKVRVQARTDFILKSIVDKKATIFITFADEPTARGAPHAHLRLWPAVDRGTVVDWDTVVNSHSIDWYTPRYGVEIR